MEAKNNELLILDEPTNYMKEVSNINFEKWLEDMKFQMDSMYTNQLQTFVDPSDMIKPMGYKLVCKKEMYVQSQISCQMLKTKIRG